MNCSIKSNNSMIHSVNSMSPERGEIRPKKPFGIAILKSTVTSALDPAQTFMLSFANKS